MRYREFKINEVSRGILYRTPGQKFYHTKDSTKFLDFQQVTNFPTNAPTFQDATAMKTALSNFQGENKIDQIYWFNQPSGALAFSIAHFKNELNQDVYYGRYFRVNTGSQQWKNTDFVQLGYQLDTPSSRKSGYKLKPADLVATDTEFKNPQEIINQIEDATIKTGLQMMPKALPSFALDPKMQPAVQDDLGEIIGPMAMWHGMDLGTQAEDARKFLLEGQPWNTCKIIFPGAKNMGLIDSVMRPAKGVAIGISSKGGKDGAKPSVKNLMSGVNQLRKTRTPAHDKILNQYKEAIEVIELLDKLSAIDGVIQLGIQRNLINESTGTAIKNTIEGKNISLAQRNALQELTKNKRGNAQSVLGYHSLSGLASLVKQSINADNKINLSNAGIKLLNSSPLIQVYMTAQTVEDKINVTGFRSVWPPQFKGTVLMDDRNYQTNRPPNGKMTFGMKSI